MGRGKIGVGEQEVQSIRYKISYKDILYKMGNVANSSTIKRIEHLIDTNYYRLDKQ